MAVPDDAKIARPQSGEKAEGEGPVRPPDSSEASSVRGHPAPDEASSVRGRPAPEETSPLKDAARAKTPRVPKARKKRQRATTDERQYSRKEPSMDASLYVNRELSWLEFNQRVLEEAKDERHPLLERVKFLSIVSSNLDEFFMIRVAAIKEQILADVVDYSPDGRTPLQQIKEVHARVEEMVRRMSECFWQDLH